MAMREAADVFVKISKNIQTPVLDENKDQLANEYPALVAELHGILWKRFKRQTSSTLTRIRKLFFEADQASQALLEYWLGVLEIPELWKFEAKDYAVGVDGNLTVGIGLWEDVFDKEIALVKSQIQDGEVGIVVPNPNPNPNPLAVEHKAGHRYTRTANLSCPTWNGSKATCAKWVRDVMEFIADMRVEKFAHFQVLLLAIKGSEVAKADFRTARNESGSDDYKVWLQALLKSCDVGRLGRLLNRSQKIKQTGSFRQFKFDWELIQGDLGRLGWPVLSPENQVIFVLECCLKPELAKVLRAEPQLPKSLREIQHLVNERGLDRSNDGGTAKAMVATGGRDKPRGGKNPTNKAACRAFAAGKCTRNPCRYSHNLCRTYARTKSCRFGDKCRFAHVANNVATAGGARKGNRGLCYHCKSPDHLRQDCPAYAKVKAKANLAAASGEEDPAGAFVAQAYSFVAHTSHVTSDGDGSADSDIAEDVVSPNGGLEGPVAVGDREGLAFALSGRAEELGDSDFDPGEVSDDDLPGLVSESDSDSDSSDPDDGAPSDFDSDSDDFDSDSDGDVPGLNINSDSGSDPGLNDENYSSAQDLKTNSCPVGRVFGYSSEGSGFDSSNLQVFCEIFASAAKTYGMPESGGPFRKCARPENFCFGSAFLGKTAHSGTSSGSPSGWFLDSGCTHHATGDVNVFVPGTLRPCRPLKFVVADGTATVSRQVGRVEVHSDVGQGKHCLTFDARFVPNFSQNLLSVRALTSLGLRVVFTDASCEVRCSDELTAVGKMTDSGLYEMSFALVARTQVVDDRVVCDDYKSEHPADDNIVRCDPKPTKNTLKKTAIPVEILHQRFGHAGPLVMKQALAQAGVRAEISKMKTCDACWRAKFNHLPKPKTSNPDKRSKSFGGRTFCDIAIVNKLSQGGKNSYLLVVDEHTRYSTVYLLASKSDSLKFLEVYQTVVSNITGKNMVVLRTDNERSFVSSIFQTQLDERGTQHELTAPHHSNQNGVAERGIQQLDRMTHAAMLHAGSSHFFWGEALHASNCVRNRLPCTSTPGGVPPFQSRHGAAADLTPLRVWGCLCYVLTEHTKKYASGGRSQRCILVGYGMDSPDRKLRKSWRCWNGNKILISADVRFDETSFPWRLTLSKTPEDLHIPVSTPLSVPVVDDEHRAPVSVAEEPPPRPTSTPPEPSPNLTRVRWSDRVRRSPDRLAYASAVHEVVTPKTRKEMLASPEVAQWLIAESIEIANHRGKTWGLPERDIGQNKISLKWVYKYRPNGVHDSSGREEKHCTAADTLRAEKLSPFKARIVARGYTQRAGVDYWETTAPTPLYKSVRILFAIAAMWRMTVLHWDAKQAFTNAKPDGDLWVSQPPGHEVADVDGRPGGLLRLLRNLNGCKQSCRLWFLAMRKLLLSLGFVHCHGDECLYILRRQGLRSVYLVLWVDDVFCLADAKSAAGIFAKLSARYEFSDLGPLSDALGTRFVQDPERGIYSMDQESTILRLIEDEGMSNCNPVASPGARQKLTKEMCPKPGEGDSRLRERYRRICGRLIHPCTVCRPDIAHAVSVACRFMHNPGSAHMQELLRILKYLRGHAADAIFYFRPGYVSDGWDEDERENRDPLPLSQHQIFLYCDADFNNDPDSGKSISGWATFLGGGPISWWSKRQGIVTLSSCESEFVCACSGSREAVWLRHYMAELGFPQDPIVLFEDNNGAIAWATDVAPIAHNRGKHVLLRFHYLREQIRSNVVVMREISTKFQTADILTKPLQKALFVPLKKKLMNHPR